MHSPSEMTRAGCTTLRGIRHWESEGLLGEVARSNGGTRQYTAEQLDKAKIIAAAQFGGWSLDETKGMLAAYDAEAYEALVIRLADQCRAAIRLSENLPKPSGALVEYDL